MGSNLVNKTKIISFLGVKGGVGCSVLTALSARVAAKKTGQRIAVLDGTPSSYSLLHSYLSAPAPRHYLFQLKPYQDHLTTKMVESYFEPSPENVAYIPIQNDEEASISFDEIFPIISKVTSNYDYLFIDLSSFPQDQITNFIEKTTDAFIVSASNPAALKSLQNFEKRFSTLHFDLKKFNIIFNLTNSSEPIPNDSLAWTKNFLKKITVPFLGGDLSIDLFEKKRVSPLVEKALTPVVEKILSNERIPIPDKNLNSEIKDHMKNAIEALSLSQIHEMHQKLIERLKESGTLKGQKNDEILQRETLEPYAKEILSSLIQEANIPDRSTRQKLMAETLNLAFGLGPLETLLQDRRISEIMVNGPHQIYIEKAGLIEKSEARFLDDQQLRTAIERILAPIGRRIDESQPYVDGRLSDGSRINAVIPPLSLNGPLLTIRKFSKRKLTVSDLIDLGSLTHEAADFLGACVKAKKNIIVSGGTGSGKTTLLNILSNFIPSNERIVTIEDSAELQLSQEHIVRLESRPANLEGKGQIAIRDLVINALRMRPDRIVVGECRGGETLDMLQAMNTGHDGSLTTVHANSPRDILSRLETMCLFTGLNLPIKAIREQISRAVHLVVQQSRLPNGKRCVTQISEIQGMEGDVIIIQDIFSLDEEKGLSRHPFKPSFISDLESIGYRWPESVKK